MRVYLLLVFCLSLVASCSGGSDDGSPDTTSQQLSIDESLPPITEGNWFRPAPTTSWQWQLQGALNTTYPVDIYDIDLFDVSVAQIQALQATGKKVICYFSAGSFESNRPDSADFNAADIGQPLDGFPDERWLDIRSANVKQVMQGRLDLAVSKSCDGVEPDNMDGFANPSGFPLSADDQLAFNRFIANEAHTRNLSVGLKNDLDQIGALVSYYDFAVNEQCFEFDECDLLTTFITANKAVLTAEYQSRLVTDANARATLCTDANNRQFSTLIMPLDLDDSFRLSCL